MSTGTGIYGCFIFFMNFKNAGRNIFNKATTKGC